jgi:hypothetical protein
MPGPPRGSVVTLDQVLGILEAAYDSLNAARHDDTSLVQMQMLTVARDYVRHARQCIKDAQALDGDVS